MEIARLSGVGNSPTWPQLNLILNFWRNCYSVACEPESLRSTGQRCSEIVWPNMGSNSDVFKMTEHA